MSASNKLSWRKRPGWNRHLSRAEHVYVNQRLRAQFGESGWANDQMSGIGYLFALRELANDIDKKWKSVLKKLEMMREAIDQSQGVDLQCNC